MSENSDIYSLSDDAPHPAPPMHWRGARRPRVPPGSSLGPNEGLARLIAVVVIVVIGTLAFRDGLQFRRVLWQSSRSVRFPGDVEFGFHNGKAVLRLAGIVQTEEKDGNAEPSVRQLGVAMTRLYRGTIENAADGNFGLDYPPLRLFIMALWARHVQSVDPALLLGQPFRSSTGDTTQPQPEDIAQPLLTLNTACDAAAAIIMFLLVWLWVIRGSPPAMGGGELRFILGVIGMVASIVAFRFALPKYMPPLHGSDWPGPQFLLAMVALVAAMTMCARSLPGAHRGWACGLVAALLVWFDPLVLVDSHVWPQWDVWILPLFLLAALLASLEWWIFAGFLLGIGCMAKGQLLLAGPILILWPLFSGKWGAAIRVMSGWALGAAAVVWPWLVRSEAAIAWLEMVTVVSLAAVAATLLRGPLMRKRKSLPEAAQMRVGMGRPASKIPWAIAAVAAAALSLVIAYFLMYRHMPKSANLGVPTLCLMLAVLIPPWLLPRKSLGFWLAAVLAASVWIGAFAFGGNFDWLTVGFLYGSHKQDKVQMGVGSFTNLATLLAFEYGWNLHDIVGTIQISNAKLHINKLFELDLKTVLAMLYAFTLVICSAAAAAQSRRKDPRLLVALVTPWLLFPLLMCQMSERYLLWAAAISAAMVAVSTGMTLLHVGLSLIGAAMMLHHDMQSQQAPQWFPALFDFITRWYPDGAWAMLLLGAIFLAVSLSSARPWRELLDD